MKYVIDSTLDNLFDVERTDPTSVGVQKQGDVGFDVTAKSVKRLKAANIFDRIFPVYEYGTGVFLAQPDNVWSMLAPRSSVSKRPAWLANSVGIVDSGYNGEVRCRFRGFFLTRKPYELGERIGQLIFMPKVNVTDHTGDGVRGEGGFGSTGK